jgi:hypothetical protein
VGPVGDFYDELINERRGGNDEAWQAILASHSSYRSFSGGWRVSVGLKSAGVNLTILRRARLPDISASK